ncbi:MAG: hypothetical protein COT06_00650 [Syntrophobacteraceae bacterium CG07_land_8_20_14_0_80_61_8]|nr:MAG: hypothetical protein COT06_00650 [Syntrophobacteraceae bacterium CG07_land_8_20_14_0_80_61_8]
MHPMIMIDTGIGSLEQNLPLGIASPPSAGCRRDSTRRMDHITGPANRVYSILVCLIGKIFASLGEMLEGLMRRFDVPGSIRIVSSLADGLPDAHHGRF